MPVPGPTMIIGTSLSSGMRNFELVGKTGIGASSARSAMKVEQTPLRCRPWLS